MREFAQVAKVSVTKDGWRCERCDHIWIPRSMKRKPRVCPSCKNAWWDQPKKAKESR